MSADPAPDALPEHDAADVAVVGAGPAGLAAATTALAGGASVLLLDAGHAVGGQYWRHPPEGSELPDGSAFHHDADTYRALRAALAAHATGGGVQVRLRHHVWTVAERAGGLEVHAVDRSGGPGAERSVRLRARTLVIAAGAHDRSLPFPGWDLPGVLTAGALQALLKAEGGVLAGRRVILGGSGPFLLPVATGLAHAGAQVVAVCEANDPRRWLRHARAAAQVPAKIVEGAGYARALARYRIPLRPRTAVVAAHGSDRVEAVTVARVRHDGQVVPGSQHRVLVDAVGVGWGFAPQLDLVRTLGCDLTALGDGESVAAVDLWQGTSVPGVFAAGETCGVGGAVLALREGQLAGEGVLRLLGRRGVTGAAGLCGLRRTVTRHRAFAAAVIAAHPVPAAWRLWLEDDTTVCRCEEVSAGDIAAVVARGARGARQVKQLTRTGMGWCQGRVCGYAAECLSMPHPPGRSAALVPPERLVAAPVPLGVLARTDDTSTM